MNLANAAQKFSIQVRDASVPRSDIRELLLEITSQPMRASDLITARVTAECDNKLIDLNGRMAARLLEQDPKEVELNRPPRLSGGDAEVQIALALAAFEANAFVLLIDDQQVENLDDEIVISPKSVVTFLKLTPLVGG